MDNGQMRWLVLPDGRSQRAADFDSVPHQRVQYFEETGLITLDVDGHLRAARNPLEALTDQGSLPPGASPDSVGFASGGVTALGLEGAWVRDGSLRWHGVRWFEDRAITKILVAGDGMGLGLFVPGVVGWTNDYGKTWHRVDDQGITALGLAADRQGRFLVLPGDERAGFGAAWVRGTSELRRCSFDDPACECFLKDADCNEPAHNPRQSAPPTDKARRPQIKDVSSVAVDGDSVIWVSDQKQRRSIWSARLGDAVLPSAEIASLPSSRNAPVMDACQGAVAVSDAHTLYLHRPGRALERLEIGELILKVGFAGPERLVVITVDSGRLVELPSAGVPRVRNLAADRQLWFSTRALVAGCRQYPDSAYLLIRNLSGSYAVANVDLMHLRVEEGESFESDFDPDFAPTLDPEGRLVLLRRGNPPELLHVSRGGDKFWHRLGFGIRGRTVLASLPTGHGLVVDTRNNLWETADGGTSWFLASGPPSIQALHDFRSPFLPRSPAAMLCGQERCELEDHAVRIGWGRPGQTGAGSARSGFSEPPSPKPAPFPLRCTEEHASWAEGQPGQSRNLELWPGVGRAVWSLVEQTQEGDHASTLKVYQGLEDGRIRERRAEQLVPTRARLPDDGEVFEAGWSVHAAGGSALYLSISSDITPANAGATPPSRCLVDLGLDDTPRARLQSFPGTCPVGLRVTEGGAWIGELGNRHRIFWLVPKQPLESRPWPEFLFASRPASSDDSLLWPALARDKSGRWLMASYLGTPDRLRLISIQSDGAWRVRTMAGDTGRAREVGFGLLGDPAGVDLILVEESPDSGHEIRLRRIDENLGLGPARRVVALGEVSGKRLPLPACTREAFRGSAVIADRDPQVIDVGGSKEEGRVARELAVDTGGACVRRTMLLGKEDGRATVVVDGDGNGPGNDGRRLLRCTVRREP
jgi:hypothetical protein